MSQSNRTAAAVFEAALQLPPAPRAAYLEEACATDAKLRRRVEDLLESLEASGSFMEESPTPSLHTNGPGQSTGLEPVGIRPEDRAVAPFIARQECAQDPIDAALGQSIDRYTLVERIGEGGCGVVYVAEQTKPVRRRVALKLIKLGMDSKQVIARFEAERQALAMMDHPNIAKVLDGGTSETGRPYFVMELVAGIPITQYCDQSSLTIRQRLELFIKVCQAIQHAHQKGIIHRDIKPSNILVTRHDAPTAAGCPKVIDFGIAKAIAGRLTDATVHTHLYQVMGTPAYMSPEQADMSSASTGDIDTRSDIYSLGVLLYELLAGCTPFDAQQLLASGIDTMRQIIRQRDPARPSTRFGTLQESESATTARNRSTDTTKLMHQLRGDLDWITMKCIENDRTRRYETANGLAFDLERYLHDEPVLARPPSAVYRLQKAFRRHWLGFSAAIAVAVTLAVGIAVTTLQTVAARKAQRETESARENESKANVSLRAQIGETERAKRLAEELVQSEKKQRRLVEGALELIRVQRADELLETRESVLGIANLLRVLRTNPSNEVAIARLVSAMLRPFGKELVEPPRHKNQVVAVQFSPDGSRMASASWDGTARVWDARNGQALTAPLLHEGYVTSVQFSQDGLRLLTSSRDHTARVWDARTGQPLIKPLQHGEYVWSARFSPDGLRVVTASYDHTARVWDARNGQPLTEPLPHGGVVRAAQFSPDGLRIVTASDDSTVRVWDPQTGLAVIDSVRHQADVYSAEFSPDGLRLVTASWDSTARLWNVLTGQPITEPIRHQSAVRTATFSPDGLRIVTASENGSAQVWNARTGQPVTQGLRHGARVWSAQFSPDGLRVVTASDDGSARVWDARSGEPMIEPLRHARKVLAAEFSPDSLRVVTASEDQTVRVWDTQNRRLLTGTLQHRGGVSSAQFSPDGSRVITASQDSTARIWDARTGLPFTGPLQHHGWVRSAEFSPDGRQVVTASDDRTARVWDAHTGRPVAGPFRHEGRVICARFSPDGLLLLTASADEDNKARVWNIRTGEPMTAPIAHGWDMPSVQFSPDGSRVATAFYLTGARVWDARTGQPLTEPITHGGFVVFMQFSPDGSRLVTASEDRTARIRNATTGLPVSESLRHEATVRSARFSPDGLRLVTASDDETARIWDGHTGKPLTEPLRHRRGVLSAQFSADGLRVVTASADNTARIWDARSGQPTSDPLQHEGAVCSAQFSPDGRWVVTASADGTARLWDVAPPPQPVPTWFLDWAEARIGRRSDTTEGTDVISFSDQQRLHRLIESRTDTNFFTRLAQWMQADPTTRAISPSGVVTTPEYVRRLVNANTLSSLREALALSPTNSSAWGRLALQLAMGAGEPMHPEDRMTEARWDAQHALKLDPTNTEAWKALSMIQAAAGRTIEALEIGDRVLKLQPNDSETWKRQSELQVMAGRPSEAIASLGRSLELNPKDILTQLTLALWQTWFGQEGDYEATRRRWVLEAESAEEPGELDPPAKVYCVRPSNDRVFLAKALRLAERAVALGTHKKHFLLPWWQECLGLAQYRNGQFSAAELTLSIVIPDGVSSASEFGGVARLFRAMALHRLGKQEAAQRLFRENELTMPPLPKELTKPLLGNKVAEPDQLLWWLAYQEAKALLDNSISLDR